jgi:hypothetical protein
MSDTTGADVDVDVAEQYGINAEQTRIEGTDNLLMKVIKDQAADFEHAWREIVQNGLDSESSSAMYLDWTKVYTIGHDNGDGVPLTKEFGENLLTNLGETSKSDDDDSTIGEFGIGKGQFIAKGMTAIISGDHALIFDIKNIGLNVIKIKTGEVESAARKIDPEFGDTVERALEKHGRSGFTVAVHHYDEETPDYGFRWDQYEENVIERFQFAEVATSTEVYINGDRVSNAPFNDALPHARKEELQEDPLNKAHICVQPKGAQDIKVYSNGVYVTDIDGRGLKGTVVTEGNLDLNFARNDISSGCDRFNVIQERLDELRVEIFGEITENQFSPQAREFVADALIGNTQIELGDEFDDKEIFKLADGGFASLNDIRSRDKIVTSGNSPDAADKLGQLGMMIIDITDRATSKLEATLETSDNDVVEVDEIFTASEKAEAMGMFTEHESLDVEELDTKQLQKLAVARELAFRLGEEIGDQRDIHYGKSDVAKAWTDGSDEIHITDASTTSNAWSQYSWQLFRQLVHEFAHQENTREHEPSHGNRYSRQYRELWDNHHEVLQHVQDTIDDMGIKQLTRGYFPEQL